MRASTSDVELHGMPFLVTILSSFLVLSASSNDSPENPQVSLLQASSKIHQTASSGASEDSAADVYYVTKMGDRFLGFMAKHQEAVNSFGAAEQERLAAAIQSAIDPYDKMLLETSARANEENRLEAQNAFGEMRNFVTTLKQAMGAVGSAAQCQDLTCGAHAHCTTDAQLGAQCICKDGYQGNGFVCKTPALLSVHSLMQFQAGQQRAQVADIHVSTLHGDTILVVYRDIAKSHQGYALLGHAAPDTLKWHSPLAFSNGSQAFSPRVTQLMQADDASGGIAIAFRNADRGGDGILLGGRVDPLTGELTLGVPKAFARHQAQAMAILPLPESRVAVIFAEHLSNDQGVEGSSGAMYGTTLLAQVHSDGSAPEIINKARFASGPVARISATALSPTLFAIAYRLGKGSSGAQEAEAACIAGQLHKSHIAFNSPAMLLEPEQPNIWSRSISRIGENLLAYTYHSGNEELTKQAILRADPNTHRLSLIHGPEVLERGFAPVVGSVAVVPTMEEVKMQKTGPFPLSFAEIHRQRSARLLTYIGHNGAKPARAQLCSVAAAGVPSGCQEIGFPSRDLATVSGTQVSDGRFVMVFTDTRGNPYYQFLGMSQPLL
jgi:hypothetical protein